VYISNLRDRVRAGVFAEPSSLRTVTKVDSGGRGGPVRVYTYV